jgi:hypothetical protein
VSLERHNIFRGPLAGNAGPKNDLGPLYRQLSPCVVVLPNTPCTDDGGEAHNLLTDAITVENEEFAIFLAEKGRRLVLCG